MDQIVVKPFTKEIVDTIIDKAQDPYQAMTAMYKFVVDDWKNVSTISAYAIQIPREMSEYIIGKLTEFPSFSKSSILMLWLNNGFGCSIPVEEGKVHTYEQYIERLGESNES